MTPTNHERKELKRAQKEAERAAQASAATRKRLLKKIGLWAAGLAVVTLIIYGLVLLGPSLKAENSLVRMAAAAGPTGLDGFAKCLTESGAVMYGQYTCSACQAEAKKFGESFRYVNYIECHPRGENPQTALCMEKNIVRTPTWFINNSRYEGYLSLEELSRLSGCPLK